MGENIFQIIENGEVVATAKVSIYDFIPIVTINEDEKGENTMWSTENCEDSKKEIVTLSDDFDKDLREYIVPEIVIVKNSVSKIPLKIKRGYDPLGPQDDDGIVTFSCSNSNVTIEIEEIASENKAEKEVSYGDKIILKIAHKLGRGSKFSVDVKGKDDTDDNFKSTDKIVTSGKLNFSIIEKDVFLKDEIQRLLVPVNSLGLSQNECIYVADARFSALVDNNTLFFNKKRAKMSHGEYTPRIKHLISKGYIKGGIISFDYIKNNGKTYRPKSLENSIYNYINREIKNKIGYHCYYISLCNDVHVLTLLINNTNSCKPTFQVLDQGTKWKKKKTEFKEIDIYFNNATISLWDWYSKKRNKYNFSSITRIAKMKRL